MSSSRARRLRARVNRSVLVAVLLAAATGVGLSGATFSASTSTGSSSFGAASAFDYATVVTAGSPYLWWRMGDTSGATTADGSGNGRAGT